MVDQKNLEMLHEYRSSPRAVGVFKKREDVAHVIRSLKDDGYDMSRVALLTRNVQDVKEAQEIQERHGNEASEGAGIGATTGTVLGGVGGFLIGVGLLAIPGVGPVLAAGAEIGALGSTLAGAGIGAATGGIVGALIGLGIPEEKAKVYEDRVKAGDYLLIVSGNDDQVHRAESIMRDRNVEEFEIFPAQDKLERERTEVHENRTEVVEPVETRTEVIETSDRTAKRREGVVTDARDIDNDGEAEVFIVDERGKRSGTRGEVH